MLFGRDGVYSIREVPSGFKGLGLGGEWLRDKAGGQQHVQVGAQGGGEPCHKSKA
jgi:hypothetical protein